MWIPTTGQSITGPHWPTSPSSPMTAAAAAAASASVAASVRSPNHSSIAGVTWTESSAMCPSTVFTGWAVALIGMRQARINAAKTAKPKVFCPTTRLAPRARFQ